MQSGVGIGDVLMGLLPVVVGGLLTAGGGFVGAYVSHRLSYRSSQNNLKREKLETLIQLAYQAMHWLDAFKNEYLFDGEKINAQSPISEMEMIADLYFPELRQEKGRVSLAAIEYSKWVLKGAQLKLQNGDFNQDYLNEYSGIYEELSNSVSALSERASEIMMRINSS